MVSTFFPNLDFAWIFLGVLFTLLALASGTDLRRYVIPKWVTLTGLVLGASGNIVRGIWLGSDGQPVWILGENGALVGGLDGFLFALCGFASGFGLFFLMWILGVCGGGDVKLFGALGCWIGAYLALCVLLVSLPVIFCLAFGQVVFAVSAGTRRKSAPDSAKGESPVSPARRRVLGFSLPLAIATVAVLLWVFRVELHLAPPPGIN
jgi:prepilin peptidase CpaA